MAHTLIGTENNNPYIAGGVFIKPDFSRYDSSGTFLDENKFIDYGFYNYKPANIDYAYGTKEYKSPFVHEYSYIVTAGSLSFSSNELTVISFDDYRQSSIASGSLTASGTNFDISDVAQHKRLCFSMGLYVLNNSAHLSILGQYNPYDRYNCYTLKATKYANNKVTLDNRYWQIINPHIVCEHVSGHSMYLEDVWYDHNVAVRPSDVASGWNGFTRINRDGYYIHDGIYYKDPVYKVDGIVKKTMKWIVNHRDNSIIICDKNNGSYRPIVSGKFPDEFPIQNFRPFGIDFGSENVNAWGGVANNAFIVKNLKFYKMNCPISQAISSEPPLYKPIYKDSITNYPDMILTSANSYVGFCPGNNELYYSTTANREEAFENTPKSSFSNSGFFVYKATIDRSNISAEAPYMVFCGNMCNTSAYDSYLNYYNIPLSYIKTSQRNTVLLVMNTHNTSAASSSAAYNSHLHFYNSSADAGTAAGVPKGDKISGFNKKYNPSTSGYVSAKYIFYKGDSNVVRCEYSEYDTNYSSYVPVCWIGKYTQYSDVIQYNNAFFSYCLSSYNSASAQVKNAEFFRTTSYYDALNG